MTTNYASYEWYTRQDLSEYAGKWISIVDKQVIAVGRDIGKVLRETKAKTKKRPLLAKIPSGKLRIL